MYRLFQMGYQFVVSAQGLQVIIVAVPRTNEMEKGQVWVQEIHR